MPLLRSRLRNIVSALAVIALAVSPFVIYALVQSVDDDSVTLETEVSPAATFPSPSPELSTPEPSPSPSPSPLPAPSSISVEVRNAGGPAGAAAEMADPLRDEGFVIDGVGDHPGSSVDSTVVLYREDPAKGEVVTSFLGVGPSEPLPSDTSTSADVLVLMGQG